MSQVTFLESIAGVGQTHKHRKPQRIHSFTCIHTLPPHSHNHTHACMHTCTHAHTFAHTCTHTHTHTYQSDAHQLLTHFWETITEDLAVEFAAAAKGIVTSCFHRSSPCTYTPPSPYTHTHTHTASIHLNQAFESEYPKLVRVFTDLLSRIEQFSLVESKPSSYLQSPLLASTSDKDNSRYVCVGERGRVVCGCVGG